MSRTMNALKRAIALLCALLLLFLAASCTQGVPDSTTPPETITEIETTTEAETTTEPEPAPDYPFAPIPDTPPAGQSDLPLTQGEMVIKQASINDIVKRFGAYENCTTEPRGYKPVLRLVYPGLAIEIEYYDYDQLSFVIVDDYWSYAEEDNLSLTDNDKAVVGAISHVEWTAPDINLPAPRGLKIGHPEEKVLCSYLDLRGKYPDTADSWKARVIYMPSDSLPEQAYDGFSSSGFYRVYTDEEYPPPVPCDYSIHYSCNDMSYMLEGTGYYIKDGRVVAIEQYCAEGD